MIIENNYSQIQHNFEQFNSCLRANQIYLSTKNQELSQFFGIDIFQSFIEQNKFLNLIWTKFNTILDDKKRMQLSLEEKALEKNIVLIQQQQNLILDLQTENKNLKSNLEKVLRKIISKNTKLDIGENLYMNKNFSKQSLNTNNLLSGNTNNSNNPHSLSTTKSQKSFLSAINNSKSKSKSKPKTGNRININVSSNKNINNLKESNSKNNLRNNVNVNGIKKDGNNNNNNQNDIRGLNTINTSMDESKSSNGENSNPNANEKLNKMQFNLNKFIEKFSAEGVINKANLVSFNANNNDNLNMSVNINHNYSHNNDLLNNSHFINKSYNLDVDRELNNLLNESHNESYRQSNNFLGSRDKFNPKNSSKQKLQERKITQNSNNNLNSQNGNLNLVKNSKNSGGLLLKGSQSMANFNDLGMIRKEKERDFSNTRGIKKDTGIYSFSFFKIYNKIYFF